MKTAGSPFRVAIFLSGGGRSLQNLIDCQRRGELEGVELTLALSSSSKVRGVEVARDAGLETHIVNKSDFSDPQSYQEAMFGPSRQHNVKLVVMAGFLKHVLIPEDFAGQVINIHPSLLPSFGGEGMYGNRVHQAALDRGVKISGCTVHYVDNDYDNGPILLQRSCHVAPHDTAASLAARVFELECQALPEAVRTCSESLA